MTDDGDIVARRDPQMVYAVMSRLVQYLADGDRSSQVIDWAAPVPYFGALQESVVATVGINPSDREFVDSAGAALLGPDRRLHSLPSLGAASWTDATGADIARIVAGCDRYFEANPYRKWFDVLDRLLHAGDASYYASAGSYRACHLDLCAYATKRKWGLIEQGERRTLLREGRSTLANVVRDSPLQLLVLNGRAVVRQFEEVTDAQLVMTETPEWSLRGSVRGAVVGVAFEGTLTQMAGIDLGREVSVLGFNHNLQSSFGVSTDVLRNIATKIGELVARTVSP